VLGVTKKRITADAVLRVSRGVSGSVRELLKIIGNKREQMQHAATQKFGAIVPKSLISWCRVRELNPRPTVYKTAALPLS
jgi:hypothetical protein